MYSTTNEALKYLFIITAHSIVSLRFDHLYEILRKYDMGEYSTMAIQDIKAAHIQFLANARHLRFPTYRGVKFTAWSPERLQRKQRLFIRITLYTRMT